MKSRRTTLRDGDIALAAHTHPPLSTVRVGKQLLGAQAVRHLPQRPNEPGRAARDTRLRLPLVPRESVGPRPTPAP